MRVKLTYATSSAIIGSMTIDLRLGIACNAVVKFLDNVWEEDDTRWKSKQVEGWRESSLYNSISSAHRFEALWWQSRNWCAQLWLDWKFAHTSIKRVRIRDWYWDYTCKSPFSCRCYELWSILSIYQLWSASHVSKFLVAFIAKHILAGRLFNSRYVYKISMQHAACSMKLFSSASTTYVERQTPDPNLHIASNPSSACIIFITLSNYTWNPQWAQNVRYMLVLLVFRRCHCRSSICRPISLSIRSLIVSLSLWGHFHFGLAVGAKPRIRVYVLVRIRKMLQNKPLLE